MNSENQTKSIINSDWLNKGDLLIYPLPTEEVKVTLPSGKKAELEIYETSDTSVFLKQTTHEGSDEPERVLIKLTPKETRKYRQELVSRPGRSEFLLEVSNLKPNKLPRTKSPWYSNATR